MDQNGWKRAVEGLARAIIGPFVQRNRLEGVDAIREYLDVDRVVMRMRVLESETEKLSVDCERVFEVDPDIVDATAFIYVPTPEELEEWSDDEIATDAELIPTYIATRERKP